MPPDTGNYNPVAEQGIIDKPSGILGRRKLRDSLPQAGHGYELVFIDANGESRPGYATAGERYWASGGTWLKIDVGDHELTYSFPYRTADGTAGYDIAVTVTVRVFDAGQAVRHKAQGVRMYVEPALSAMVHQALPAVYQQNGGDSLTTLNVRRDQVAQAVRGTVTPGSSFQLDGWLHVHVAGVSVAFDTATAFHHDQLVDAARDAELDIIQLRNKERSARAEINLRKTWSDYLEPRLVNPLTRAVETVAANPTQESIQQVVSQLDASDQWTKAEVVAILNKLIDKDFVGDISELQAIKVIVEGLQRTPSSTSLQISPPEISDEVIAEIVGPADDVTPDDSSVSDRDWAD